MAASQNKSSEQQLLLSMREANENLVVATVRAEQLAEAAEQARAATAESEERFRSLVTASSAIVWWADVRGRVQVERDSWFSFTGLPVREGSFDDDDWLVPVHPDDRARVRDAWHDAVRMSTVFTCEHRLQRLTGGYGWVLARAVPIMRDGKAREWIGTMSDITERVELERARELFIAMMSHDLRSPLAAIGLMAETLQGLQLGVPYDSFVAEISKTSRRMGSLVSDLMDFARRRLGTEMPVNRRLCDAGEICSQAVDELARIHPSRAITVTRSGNLQGSWDPGRLGQLVSNLVDNAIGHGLDPIRVSVEDLDDIVRLMVENHGPEIPASARADLFESFKRRTSVERSAGTGLGLGLYIVQEIVRAHGGSVTVTSLPDVTRFAVDLPRSAAAPNR